MSGDRRMFEVLLNEYRPHAAQAGRQVSYLSAVVSLANGDLTTVPDAYSAVTDWEAVEWHLWAIPGRVGVAHFLPEDHPDRRPLVEEALPRCDELGIAGFKRLVEQHAPSVM